MKPPSIGVVIATPGRVSVYRTLRSILYQGLLPGDDIFVVGDGFHQPTKDLVEAFGPPFRYIATQPTHDWGHSQFSWGLKRVQGDIVTYQDDGDIFLPRAFEEMRRLAGDHTGVPMIGRVKTPHWGLLWSEPGVKTLLSGQCLIAPNDKKKLGFFTGDGHGDQCYISTTIANYPGINWVDRVWSYTSPTWKLFPHRGKAVTPYQENFYREMCARLPAMTDRPLNGPNDWFWVFHTEERGLAHPVAAAKVFEEDGRTWATISCVPGEQGVVEEVVEFAAWAGQGQEVWFATLSDDVEIISELQKKGFQEHMLGAKLADFTLSWPPKWFPSKAAVEITDEQGAHLLDWRDKWGA